jgi:DNA-binding MarR family transcriptional regulator
MSENGFDLSSLLTFRMARVQAKLNAQGSRILREVSGLSLAQWRILLILGADGETTPSEVSRNAQFDKGLLSRKLKLLIEDGLVKTRPHPTDRRQQILSLTPAGQKMFQETLPHMTARQERLRGLFEEEELSVLYDVFDKIEDALEQGSVG